MTADSNVVLQQPGASFGGEQLVTFRIDDQMFGIPALSVRDVLRRQSLTRVPLAAPEIAGAINLRGHIVTAVNVRMRLGAARPAVDGPQMCVVVERGNEAFCLLVDSVGDVISVYDEEVQPNPASLPAAWAELSRGVYRLNDGLLLIIDVDQLLTW